MAVNDRNVWVYTPRGFRQTDEAYPLVVVMGGAAYLNFTSVPAVLDNLIAEKRIPPVVAVVVSASEDDLSCSSAYASFLAEELVPWMQAIYRATDDPARAVIAGSSLGSLASTFVAVNHPDVFGNVLSQSGSYWWKREFGSRGTPDDASEGEWLTRQIRDMDRVPVRFFLEVGRMEAPEIQLATNRRMHETLVAKGYRVTYQEFNGNHNYINWRGGFGTGLIELLGE